MNSSSAAGQAQIQGFEKKRSKLPCEKQEPRLQKEMAQQFYTNSLSAASQAQVQDFEKERSKWPCEKQEMAKALDLEPGLQFLHCPV